MNDQILMRGMHGEHRLFNTAVTVSLLLHAAVIWWAQAPSTLGNEESTAPAFSSIEVALVPRQTMPERREQRQESRAREVTRTPVRQASVPVAPDSSEAQPTSAPESTVPTDNFDEAPLSGANESAAQSGGAVNAGVRDRYLASVLAHIESHKFYPPAARRRGLQGSVEVCFTLDALGMITDLHITGSNSLFVEAAKTAVRNAIPLPAAPSIDGFPLSVRYKMLFKLQ